jgi:hypothetical protein
MQLERWSNWAKDFDNEAAPSLPAQLLRGKLRYKLHNLVNQVEFQLELW